MAKKTLFPLFLILPFLISAQPFYHDNLLDNQGVVIRSDRSERRIRLLFTGHAFADGALDILHTLKEKQVTGFFFFTGDFVRTYPQLTKKIYRQGHFVGPHSDKHLLYCDWDKRDSLLLSRETFMADLEANYAALDAIGIPRPDKPLFVAPYEWYNKTITRWCSEAGILLINFTPHTGTNADYTTPDAANYKSSDRLFDQLFSREKEDHGWLNGAQLLIHIGTDPRRTDKFYHRLGELIDQLRAAGYLV